MIGKRLFLVIFVLGLFFTFAFAGEIVDLPSTVQMVSPDVNQAEKMHVKIYFGPAPFASLEFYPIDDDSRRGKKIMVKLEDAPTDDPTSITANCTGKGEPWQLCTGTAECYNDCDESTVFTNFVAGFASTLNDRAEAAMWAEMKRRFIIVP
jgi:hypothetical protein